MKFPATRGDGTVDIYLTKWTFFGHPERPPHVTFVNPKTKEYDPACWPDAGNSRLQLPPEYGAPQRGARLQLDVL